MEFEKFYGKIWRVNETLVITIPSNYVKYGGFKEGDNVKVMIKKEEKVE